MSLQPGDASDVTEGRIVNIPRYSADIVGYGKNMIVIGIARISGRFMRECRAEGPYHLSQIACGVEEIFHWMKLGSFILRS